jgi:Secretion system C-terminal sorting domain
MAKHFTLQINEPCHEDWNLMSPSEQGRYCGMCQKSVVDFTNMTDTQLSNYFKLNTGNTCGRFYDDQLNHPIAVPTRTIPWLRYFFTITLPAFLFSLKTTAQKKVGTNEIVTTTNKSKKNISVKKSLKNKGGYIVHNIEAIYDTTKNFKNLNLGSNITKCENLKVETLKEVIVYGNIGRTVGRLMICSSKVSGGVSIVSEKKTDSIFDASFVDFFKRKVQPDLTVFPNPSTSNAILNIAFNKDFVGVVVIEIFAANGQLIKKESKNLTAKTKSTTINTNNFPAGFYICSVTELKTNKKISNEFIVY